MICLFACFVCLFACCLFDVAGILLVVVVVEGGGGGVGVVYRSNQNSPFEATRSVLSCSPGRTK